MEGMMPPPPEVLSLDELRHKTQEQASEESMLPDPEVLNPADLRKAVKDVERQVVTVWFWLARAYYRIRYEKHEMWIEEAQAWEQARGLYHQWGYGSFREYIEGDIEPIMKRAWRTARQNLQALEYIRQHEPQPLASARRVPPIKAILALDTLHKRVFDDGARRALVAKGVPEATLPTAEQWKDVHNRVFAREINERETIRECRELALGIRLREASDDSSGAVDAINKLIFASEAISKLKGKEIPVELAMSLTSNILRFLGTLRATVGPDRFSALLRKLRRTNKRRIEQ